MDLIKNNNNHIHWCSESGRHDGVCLFWLKVRQWFQLLLRMCLLEQQRNVLLSVWLQWNLSPETKFRLYSTYISCQFCCTVLKHGCWQRPNGQSCKHFTRGINVESSTSNGMTSPETSVSCRSCLESERQSWSLWSCSLTSDCRLSLSCLLYSQRCNRRNFNYAWLEAFTGPYTQDLDETDYCTMTPLRLMHFNCPLIVLCGEQSQQPQSYVLNDECRQVKRGSQKK